MTIKSRYDVMGTASGYAVYAVASGRDRYAEFLGSAEAAEAAARLNAGVATEDAYEWLDTGARTSTSGGEDDSATPAQAR